MALDQRPHRQALDHERSRARGRTMAQLLIGGETEQGSRRLMTDQYDGGGLAANQPDRCPHSTLKYASPIASSDSSVRALRPAACPSSRRKLSSARNRAIAAARPEISRGEQQQLAVPHQARRKGSRRLSSQHSARREAPPRDTRPQNPLRRRAGRTDRKRSKVARYPGSGQEIEPERQAASLPSPPTPRVAGRHR